MRGQEKRLGWMPSLFFAWQQTGEGFCGGHGDAAEVFPERGGRYGDGTGPDVHRQYYSVYALTIVAVPSLSVAGAVQNMRLCRILCMCGLNATSRLV
jgi:hypothetical protein